MDFSLIPSHSDREDLSSDRLDESHRRSTRLSPYEAIAFPMKPPHEGKPSPKYLGRGKRNTFPADFSVRTLSEGKGQLRLNSSKGKENLDYVGRRLAEASPISIAKRRYWCHPSVTSSASREGAVAPPTSRQSCLPKRNRSDSHRGTLHLPPHALLHPQASAFINEHGADLLAGDLPRGS